MDDVVNEILSPDGWFAVLAESEADIAAGRIVPGEEVMRDLRESLARLETSAPVRTLPKGTPAR